MIEDVAETVAFACCSAGIGRWFWAVWPSESDAQALAPVLASGFEKNADAAEKKAIEAVGAELKHLPGKWASRYRKGGGLSARNGEAPPTASKPKSRLSRRVGTSGKNTPSAQARLLVFRLRERPARGGRGGQAPDRQAEPQNDPRRSRAVPRGGVDKPGGRRAGRPEAAHAGRRSRRAETRGEGLPSRFVLLRQRGGRHPGCPCGPDIEARLVLHPRREISLLCRDRQVRLPPPRPHPLHPDAGGDPSEFLAVEQAYRHALAYFSPGDAATARPEPE